MKKKKIINLIPSLLIVLFFVMFLLCYIKKNNNNDNNMIKNISIDVEKKFESKLYAAVINDVTNDYSYHDYNESIILNDNIINNDYDINFDSDKEDEALFQYEEETEIINEIEVNNNETIVSEDNNESKEEIVDEKENITNDETEKEEVIDEKEEVIDEKEEIIDEKDSNENSRIEQIKDEKNGFIEENGITYYYENNNRITGIKNINGINNYFSPSGRYLGTSNIKILDISYYQGDINWNELTLNGDFYGIILRVGYYSFPDKKFEEYISNVKRLNIPYGIYLFSYAGDLNGSKREASFTNNMIDKYSLEPTLGIYYDIESWTSKNATSDNISKNLYDQIIENYISTVSNHVSNLYKVKVYSGRWYAMNRLGSSKRYVDWVAEYNNSCLYDEFYSMWQYTSTGSMPGINGNVDISYLLTQ